MSKKFNPKVIAFNVAVFSFMGIAVAVQIRAWLNPPQSPVCSSRYPRAVKYGLERDGVLLQASDVQATSYGSDFGVLDNLSVIPAVNGPDKHAMAVNLNTGTTIASAPTAKGGGISFPWKPRSVPEGVSSACLTYHIYLPADFDFSKGGTLPGMYGTSPIEGASMDERFSSHLIWGSDGRVTSRVTMTAAKTTLATRTNDHANNKLPVGRWVKIDQELVLNDTRFADGRMRLWIDNVFSGEAADAQPRVSKDTSIEGIVADVHFGASKVYADVAPSQATKDERILITPFELRWN